MATARSQLGEPPARHTVAGKGPRHEQAQDCANESQAQYPIHRVEHNVIHLSAYLNSAVDY